MYKPRRDARRRWCASRCCRRRKQQIAEVLLTAVKPKPPARWEVNPAVAAAAAGRGPGAADRLGPVQLRQHRQAAFMQTTRTAKWAFQPDLLEELVQGQAARRRRQLTDPFGGKLTLDEPGHAGEGLHGRAIWPGRSRSQRMQQPGLGAGQLRQQPTRRSGFKDGKWTFPRRLPGRRGQAAAAWTATGSRTPGASRSSSSSCDKKRNHPTGPDAVRRLRPRLGRPGRQVRHRRRREAAGRRTSGIWRRSGGSATMAPDAASADGPAERWAPAALLMLRRHAGGMGGGCGGPGGSAPMPMDARRCADAAWRRRRDGRCAAARRRTEPKRRRTPSGGRTRRAAAGAAAAAAPRVLPRDAALAARPHHRRPGPRRRCRSTSPTPSPPGG